MTRTLVPFVGRRLVASLILLSVVARTLSWTSTACADLATDSRAMPMSVMVAAGDMAAAAQPTDPTAQDELSRCADHESLPTGDTRPPAHAVTHCDAAHCAPAAIAVIASSASRALMLFDAPHIARDMMPRGITTQPELPPPRA